MRQWYAAKQTSRLSYASLYPFYRTGISYAGCLLVLDALNRTEAEISRLKSSLKDGEEEIVGLMVALERYVQRDRAADQHWWREQCNTIAAAIVNIREVKAVVLQDDWARPVPELCIRLTSDWPGPSPDAIIDAMAKGDPPIIIRGSRQLRWEEQLFVNPHILVEGEAELVGQRLRIVRAEKC